MALIIPTLSANIVRSVAHPQGAMVSVVNLAKACQEEEERANERHSDKSVVGSREVPRHQRTGKPRSRDHRFIHHLTSGETQQVSPLHGPESLVRDWTTADLSVAA